MIDVVTGSPSGSPVVRSTVVVWPACAVTGFGDAEIVGGWFGGSGVVTDSAAVGTDSGLAPFTAVTV